MLIQCSHDIFLSEIDEVSNNKPLFYLDVKMYKNCLKYYILP